MGGSLAAVARRPGPEGAAAMGRDLRRRQLRTGKKGGLEVGKTKRGKGTKWMVLVDGQGIPLGALLASASPAEVNLLEPTLEKVRLPSPDGERGKHHSSKAAEPLPRIRRALAHADQVSATPLLSPQPG